MPIYPIKQTGIEPDLELDPPYPGSYRKEGKWYLDIPDIELFLIKLTKEDITNEIVLSYNKFNKSISVEIYNDFRE